MTINTLKTGKKRDLFNLKNNMDTKRKVHKLAISMSTLGIKTAFLTISRVKF